MQWERRALLAVLPRRIAAKSPQTLEAEGKPRAFPHLAHCFRIQRDKIAHHFDGRHRND